MEVRPIWFDSLGAKSSCVLVRTPDLSLLIDPGAAVMHRSFPLSVPLKEMCWQAALGEVYVALREATHIAVTHYHLDHCQPAFLPEFRGKTLWLKDPNRWINASQWKQARALISGLCGRQPRRCAAPAGSDYPDPLEQLSTAGRRGRSLRRADAWRRNLDRLRLLWEAGAWIDEEDLGSRVSFADGRFFRKGRTTIRFTQPLLHGSECTRAGWVVGVVVTHGTWKLVYTSDVQGPMIEDYAQWIIDEHPDMLVLDGPATSSPGAFLPRREVERAMSNCFAVVREAGAEITILDHHIARHPHYRVQAAEAYARGAVTGAELLGRRPLVEMLEPAAVAYGCAHAALPPRAAPR